MPATNRAGIRATPRRLRAGVGAVAVVAALLIVTTGALAAPERQTVDLRFAVRGPGPPPPDIVIVALDDASLESFNVQMPIPRSYYARLLEVVHAAGPRLIGLDLQFSGASDRPEEDEDLLAAIAAHGPVLVATTERGDGPVPGLAGVQAAGGAVMASGAVDTDPDGVLRRMMYAQIRMKTFAVQAAELIRKAPVGEEHFRANRAWIDFRGPPGTFPTFSLADVLTGKVPPATFAGKAVLVGVTAPIAKDVFTTAASSNPMSGVEVQANALWTALNGFPLRPAAPLVNLAALLLACTLPPLAGRRFSALAVSVGAIVALALWVTLVQWAFAAGWLVNALAPVVGLVLATGGVVGVDAFIARRQVRALEKALDGFLRPAPVAFFISYRRDQEGFVASTLRAMLAARFGHASVFLDRRSLTPGQEWPREIEEAILGCSAMLVLIGPYWLAADAEGGRRIDDPGDWVRREVEGGLRRPEIAVVPVLVDGADMPAADDLPEPLKPLAERQAFVLRGDDPDTELDGLISAMQGARARRVRSPDGSTPARSG